MTAHKHALAPTDPQGGVTFSCVCGYSAEFVVLDDGLPGEWVDTTPITPEEGAS